MLVSVDIHVNRARPEDAECHGKPRYSYAFHRTRPEDAEWLGKPRHCYAFHRHDPRTRNGLASLAIPTRFIRHDPRTRNGSASLVIPTRFLISPNKPEIKRNRVTKESVSFISFFRKIFTIAWDIISISLPVLSTKQVS